MEFSAKDVLKLIDSEHEFCGLDYKQKGNDSFTASLTGKEREGWLQASGIGFGVACLSRNMLLEMMQQYPELRYMGEDGVYFALFDFLLHDGQYWGEDYTFCRRYIEIGGDISVLKDAETGHIGSATYRGNHEIH